MSTNNLSTQSTHTHATQSAHNATNVTGVGASVTVHVSHTVKIPLVVKKVPLKVKKIPLKVKTKTDFDFMIDYIATKIKEEGEYNENLCGVTNIYGIKFNSIHVAVSPYHNDEDDEDEKDIDPNAIYYYCYIQKNRKEGEKCDFDEGDDEDDEDDILFNTYYKDKSLKVAISMALAQINNWNTCQDCGLYIKNDKLINNKCPSCVFNGKLLDQVSPDKKFECGVCKAEKLKSMRTHVVCKNGHKDFCQPCMNRVMNGPKQICPLCRGVILD